MGRLRFQTAASKDEKEDASGTDYRASGRPPSTGLTRRQSTFIV